MNHIYRIVWNALTNTWVAVAENARSQGKGSKRTASKTGRKAGAKALVMATLAMVGLAVTAAIAQTVPTGGNTTVYISANGVPVIDINTANAAGLSHNRFTSYNVDARGLVLNNGNMDQLSRLSQLAGQVAGNANLAQQARVILNEVVSTNRSLLAGFTEVLGGRADVVVANPNGITCNGCGFINTDRITLTTGTPGFGADGSLNGFNVNRGDVLITGAGANANAQQIFDIVARTVRIDGKINTSDTGSLGITAGANNWSYGGRNVTGAASPSGAAGAYAIDSTALGGMYSGRINIIATEAGVGVRMLGEAAASADNFRLTSAGKIELQAALSAKQDLTVTTTAASGNEDLFVNGAAKLSAAANLALNAAGGQIKLAEGELYAANNLTTTAASLSDASAAAKTRFAGGSNTLAITGAANINGTAWGAGGALTGNANNLTIGNNGATLYAGTTLALSTTNNLALGTAAVRSAGNMTLAADTGSITTAAGAAQGIQSTTGNLSLSAGSGLTNAGKITADVGSVTGRINGTLANSGSLQAKTTLDLADKAGGGTENIVNSGILLADGGLTVKATSIDNQAGATLQGGAGTTLVANSLNNAGTLIASNAAGQAGALTLATLTNSGTLQSAGNLDLNLTATLANTGKVLATNNLAVNAGASAITISNTGAAAVLQAGNALTVNGTNVTFGTQSGTVLGNTVGLTLASGLNNAGTLQSNDAMTLSIGGSLTNTGTLLAKGGLTSTSDTVDNSGTLTLADNAGANGTVNAKSLTNSGTLQSKGNTTLNLNTALNNSGKVLASNNLAVNAGNWGLAISNTGNSAVLQAGNALTVTGSNATFDTQQGTVLGNTVGLTVASLNNSGTLQSNDTMTLAVGGASINSGTLLAKGGLTSNSATLTNSGSLTAADVAGINSIITASTVTNSGTLQSKGDLTLNLTQALANTGKVLATNNLSVNAGTSAVTLNNTGAAAVLQAGNALAVNGSNVTFGTQSGTVLGKTVGLTLAGDFTNSGTLQSSEAMTLTVAGALTNSGTLLAKGGLTSNSAILNNTGTLTAADVAGINSIIRANTVTNSGTLQSSGNLAMNLATGLTNSGSLLSGGNLTLRGTAGTYTVNANAGRLQAGGVLDIKGSNNSRDVNINVANGATLLGGSMDINAGTLALADNAMVSTTGNMTVGVNNLTFGGSNSRIVAATSGTGVANVTTASAFNNVGAVHSGGDMTFDALSITNTGTGAFSALRTLSVSATTGDLDNYGALYAGQTLNANAMLTLTNRAGATIDSGGDINIDTPAAYLNGTTFTNNSTVNATGNINIAATYFNNSIQASNARAWSAYGYGTENYSRTSASERPYVATAGWNSGAIASNGCRAPDAVSVACDVGTEIRSNTWTRAQYFTAPSPVNAVKPQIIAGGTTTISNFQTANNLGGVISGNSVVLTSGRGGATFTNDDLVLRNEAGTLNSTVYSYWAGIAFNALTARYKGGTGSDYSDGLRTVYPNGTTTLDGKQGMALTSRGFTPSVGAGLFANGGTITITGNVRLINIGGEAVDLPKTASPINKTATGAAATTLASTNGVTAANLASPAGVAAIAAAGVTGITNVNGQAAVAFAGLVINLPTNPNGFFVISTNPSARYLVETNPRFVTGSGSLGSDFLLKRLGINPDTVLRRLGDANYEAFLVRQQLIAQTGNNILRGYGNEADQMKRLMDQSADQSKDSGLVFGKALTPDQIANLKSDIVWMVETTVAGQRVLAPVVYLATATRLAVVAGAVIAGTNVKMDVASLTNTGGTIGGEKSLQVVSRGDITNTAGTITGGNVSLRSTEGSINNITTVVGNIVSNTGTIAATGNLALDAKKDILVSGGQVNAAGDATLRAGRDVRFDTIVKTETTNSSTSTDNGSQRTEGTSTTTTTTNVGSSLATGGRLNISSDRDTTIAGSRVNAGGGMAVDAGGNFNVLARQDTSTTRSQSTTSGQGVGGGMIGTQTVTTDSFRGTNAGSTINVGTGTQPGNMTVRAGGAMTLQGSDLNVSGNAVIDAQKGINVLDGLNESRTTTTTNTNAFLVQGPTGSSTDAGSGAGAGANAKAGAEASGNGGGSLARVTDTVTQTDSRNSVASNFRVGGNLVANTQGTLTVQGSNLAVAGNAALNARDGIRVLDGENTQRTTTTTSTTDFLKSSGDGNASAGANAGADASGSAALKGGLAAGVAAGAKADANANAQAAGTASVSLMENNVTVTQTDTRRSAGSSLSVGGNLAATTQGVLTVQGSNLSVGGNAALTARQGIRVLDGENTQRTTTTSVTTSVLKTELGTGAVVQANAGSGAGGDAATGNGAQLAADKISGNKAASFEKPSANGQANTGANATADANGTFNTKLTEVSTTNSQSSSRQSVASGLNIGGNLNAQTEGTLTMRGANVAAGGDVALQAKNVEVLAGRNEASSSSSTVTASVGVFRDANANATGGANANAGLGTGNAENGSKASAAADAKAGVSANANVTAVMGVRGEVLTSESSSLTNTASTITGGRNVTINATETARFVGAQVQAGGDLAVEAKNIVNLAAQDTTSNTSSRTQGTAGIYVEGNANAQASASVGKTNQASASAAADANMGLLIKGTTSVKADGSTTQQVSSFTAGGNITRTAAAGITDQGTQLTAGGNINQKATTLTEIDARDSRFSTSVTGSTEIKGGVGARAGADASATGGANAIASAGIQGSAKAEVNVETENSSKAVTGRYTAGGNINSATTGKTTLIGTQFTSGGDTNINAASLDFKAAQDTSSKVSNTTSANVGGRLELAANTIVGGSLEGSASNTGTTEKTTTARAGGISAGGNLNINVGGDAKLEGTKIQSTGQTAIAAGGSVELTAARDTKETSDHSVGASAGIDSGKAGLGVKASVTVAGGGGSASTAQAGSIQAGNGGISITAGKDVKLEGTAIETTGNTALKAGGTVEMKAAVSTDISASAGLSGGIAGTKTKDENGMSNSVGGNVAASAKVESQAVSIKSGGGNVTIAGANVTNQQANIETSGTTAISGNVTNQDTVNVSLSGGLSGNMSKESKPKPKPEAQPKPKAEPKLKAEPKTKTEAKPVTKPQGPPLTEPVKKPAGEPGKAGSN